ncbi:MAG TPA: PA14 domain-containing protein [Tepidisphaeraceae bacterium]|nr:PA14 domain-containing protein [Tepidisphaeraceae bacterium]
MSRLSNRKAARKVSGVTRRGALERAVRPVLQAVPWELLEDRRLLAVDPVMVYTFDEASGTVAADTGTGDAVANNGTLVAGDDYDLLDPAGDPNDPNNQQSPTLPGSLPAWVTPGKMGAAHLQFPGAPDPEPMTGHAPLQDNPGGRVDLANPLHPLLGATASLSAWVKIPAGLTGSNNPWQTPAITGAEQTGAANDIFWGFLDAQGRLGARAGNGATAFTVPINDGQWHRVTFTRDSGNGQIRAYTDGVQTGAVTSETGVKGANFRSIGALTAVDQNDLSLVQFYNHWVGELDQVEIFDRVLPAAEVTTRYGTATAAPTKPVISGITSPGPKTAIINWGDVPDETVYIVARGTSAAGPFTDIATLNPGVTTFTDRAAPFNATAFYIVRAVNSAGTTNSDPVSVQTAATGEGLNAYYFNNNFWGEVVGVDDAANRPNNPFGGWTAPGTPVAPGTLYPTIRVSGNPDVTEAVPWVNYDFGGDNADPNIGSPHPNIRDNHFSTVYQGKLVAPEDGEYLILGAGDDDTHVYVNGVLVSSDPLGHGVPANSAAGQNNIEYKVPIDLVAGQQYDIVVLQSEGTGGTGVFLRWVLPSDTSKDTADIVPSSALRTTLEAPQAATNLQEALTSPLGDSTLSNNVRINFTDNSTRELLYQLERSTDGTNWTVVNESGINADSLIDANPLAGVATQYRVVAINRATNGRTASAPITVTPAADPTPETGAAGYFFNDQWWNSRPPITGDNAADNRTANAGDVVIGRNPDVAYNVGEIDENWGANADPSYNPELNLGDTPVPASPHSLIRDNRFSSVFTGKITTLAAHPDDPATPQDESTMPALYYFNTRTDDDGYLWVNGVLASADPGGHGIRDSFTRHPQFYRAGPFGVLLAPNTSYNFVMAHSEGASGADAELEWAVPGSNPFDGAAYVPIEASQFTSIPDLPATPTNVRQVAVQNRVVNVRWDDVSTSELRYVISRAPADAAGNPTGAFADLATLPINATEYVDRAVTGGQNYVYRVRAENFRGTSGSGQTAASTTAAEVVPAAPSDLVVTGLDTGNRLAFTDNAVNETQFIIERRLASEPDSAFFRIPGTPIGENGPGDTGTVVFTDTDPLLQPGQTYVYRVAATNPAGTSAFVTSTASQAGLEATITDADFTYGTQGIVEGGNFNDPIVRTDATIDFNFVEGSPDGRVNADQFSIVWEGEFIAPESGDFTFFGRSDDGMRVFINNQMIVDAWVPRSAAETASAPVTLVAGQSYPIQVQYFEQGGFASVQLLYQGPTTPKQVVPATQFRRPDVTRALVAPLSITTTNPLGNSIRVQWVDPNASETGFVVQRNPDPSNAAGWTTVGTVPANQQSFFDEAPNGSFSYRVIPVRGATQGPASPVSDAISPQGQPGGPLNFPNFSAQATQDQWTLNSTGTNGTPTWYDLDGDGATERLRLTYGGNDEGGVLYDGQTGTAFLNTPQAVDGFTASFDFVMGGPANSPGPNAESGNPADGFTFILQNDTRGTAAVGGGGGALGWNGITNSVAVKFDVHDNIDEVGLYINGEGIANGTGDARNRNLRTGRPTGQAAFDLDSGNPSRATITYDPVAKVLTLTVDDIGNAATDPIVNSWGIDIPHVIGSSNAYVGFGGATGGESVRQDITSFSFDPTAPSVPTLSVADVTVTEGNTGTSNATFTVTLSAPSTQQVRVNYATSNAGATAGAAPNDYTATSGTLTFAPGETTKTVNVPILGDTTAEPNEAFFFTLSAPVNAGISRVRAVGTITDDDRAAPPGVPVDAVYVSGTGWSADFYTELAEENLGDANGYRIMPGAAGEDELPWTNINRVSFKFGGTAPVTVAQDDLAWVSGANITYAVTNFAYDPITRVATWTLDKPLANFTSTNRQTADKVNFALDGDAGGANIAGGDYRFRLNVVPGDANRNGNVSPTDYGSVRSGIGRNTVEEGTAPTNYTVFKDVNANGNVSPTDIGVVRGQTGANITNVPDPAQPAGITEDLFSNTAIL